MEPRCKAAWHWWIAGALSSFTYLELRAFRRGCHRTLSRQLARWLGCRPTSRWRGPTLFALAWALLAAHVALLEDDTVPVAGIAGSSCRREQPDTERSVTP